MEPQLAPAFGGEQLLASLRAATPIPATARPRPAKTSSAAASSVQAFQTAAAEPALGAEEEEEEEVTGDGAGSELGAALALLAKNQAALTTLLADRERQKEALKDLAPSP